MTREILRAAMNRKGINIPKLAHEVKCDRQTLYNFFGGRTSIRVKLLDKILPILDLEIRRKK